MCVCTLFPILLCYGSHFITIFLAFFSCPFSPIVLGSLRLIQCLFYKMYQIPLHILHSISFNIFDNYRSHLVISNVQYYFTSITMASVVLIFRHFLRNLLFMIIIDINLHISGQIWWQTTINLLLYSVSFHYSNLQITNTF